MLLFYNLFHQQTDSRGTSACIRLLLSNKNCREKLAVIIIFICIPNADTIRKKNSDVSNLKISFMFTYLLSIENRLTLILLFVLSISNNNNSSKSLKNACILIVEIVLKLFTELPI